MSYCRAFESQDTSADAIPLAELCHERRQLPVGQRGMVLDGRHLRLCRQELVQVPFPKRGILAGAKLQCLGAV